MKNTWKYFALGAAAAAVLTPFKVKYDSESGEFEYRSLLLGVHKKKDEQTGESNTAVSFFNLPKHGKKDDGLTDIVADGESVLILDESELATVETPEETLCDHAEEPEQPAEITVEVTEEDIVE